MCVGTESLRRFHGNLLLIYFWTASRVNLQMKAVNYIAFDLLTPEPARRRPH